MDQFDYIKIEIFSWTYTVAKILNDDGLRSIFAISKADKGLGNARILTREKVNIF